MNLCARFGGENMMRVMILAAALAVAAAPGAGQVGEPLKDPGLSEFSQTEARSWKELATGRLVLLEFFAHW